MSSFQCKLREQLVKGTKLGNKGHQCQHLNDDKVMISRSSALDVMSDSQVMVSRSGASELDCAQLCVMKAADINRSCSAMRPMQCTACLCK